MNPQELTGEQMQLIEAKLKNYKGPPADVIALIAKIYEAIAEMEPSYINLTEALACLMYQTTFDMYAQAQVPITGTDIQHLDHRAVDVLQVLHGLDLSMSTLLMSNIIREHSAFSRAWHDVLEEEAMPKITTASEGNGAL